MPLSLKKTVELALLAAALAFACNNTPPAPVGPAGTLDPSAPDPSSPPAVTTPPPISVDAPGLDPAIFPELGATEFMTANQNELLSSGTYSRGANSRDELAFGGDVDADGAAEGEPAPPGADPGVGPGEAPPDPNREIVEADVFKLEGDRLYVLNRHRGLVILDVADPDNMRILGRLPFQSIPVEMYVREGRAYVVMSDYFVYWQYDPEADPRGFHGSRVLIVDVEDPTLPEAMGTLPIDGEVTDTRLVGDVLYAVSKRRPDYWRYNTVDWSDTTWIVSLNVADPADIRAIDRLEFTGMSTLIHVAPHAIFVAGWDPNYYLTDALNEQETLITYVDISDAEGGLRQRGHVYIPGQIADKFKMSWFDGALRVLSQRWNGDSNITLHVVDTDRPDDLEIDAQLELEGVTRSGLMATRYDGDRAFAMTQRWQQRRNDAIRELHALDLSDPGAPRRASVIELPLAVSHFEIHGDRLLALGWMRVGRQNRAALGLVDIEDLGEPRVISTQALGEGWSSSEANGDYKALKVFRDLELILVPLDYTVRRGGNRYERFSGVQLVDWVGDDLTERGRAENTGGVRRAFPVGDRIVVVGEKALATLDATDRDNPEVTRTVHLLRQVHDIFDVGGLQAQIVSDVYSGGLSVQVREFGREDDAPIIAELALPFTWAPAIFRDGDVLHMLGWEASRGQVIRNLDLSDPRAPRLRGELELSDEAQRIYNQGMSFYQRYWSPNAGLALRNQILPATFRTIVEDASGRRDFDSVLRFIDLRDPDDPRFADGEVEMNDYPFVNKITHGDVLFSSHVEQAATELDGGASLLYHVRSYVDRIDVSDPDHPIALPSVNVPGYLVDVSEDGDLLYTIDYQWDDFGRRRNSLNVLRLIDEDRAQLVEVIPVADQIHRAAMRGQADPRADRAVSEGTIWLTAHKYPWWGVRSDTVESRQPYTVLRRLRFADTGRLRSEVRNTLAGYHFDLLDVEDNLVYLATRRPSGLLVLDVANPAEPVIDNAARTIGYLSRIVVHGDHVYTPMGLFGVYRY